MSVDLSKQTTALLLSRFKTWELEERETSKSAEPETQKAYAAGHGKGRRKSKPKRIKQDWAEQKKRTKFHICKQEGHWKSECTQKKDKQNEKTGPSGKAYMPGNSDDCWKNYSGADGHYCGRLDWFYEYVKYLTARSVNIANNSVGRRDR